LHKIARDKAGCRIDDFGFDKNAAHRRCRHKIVQQLFFLFALARRALYPTWGNTRGLCLCMTI
jgi:hypothetical protein